MPIVFTTGRRHVLVQERTAPAEVNARAVSDCVQQVAHRMCHGSGKAKCEVGLAKGVLESKLAKLVGDVPQGCVRRAQACSDNLGESR